MPEIQFDSLTDFFNMGGYAFYVWFSYLFSVILLGANLVLPLRDRRRLMNLLKARMQRDAAQPGPTKAGE